jgi:hypothetical protein
MEVGLSLEDLVLGPGAPAPAPEPTPAGPVAPTVPIDGERLRWRKAVEALRFGIVPVAGIERLTLGFSALDKWVMSQLPHNGDGRPQVAEICGPFGTGKSHTMSAVRYLAEREGYLTARVEVDGTAVTLSDPGGLLYHLWATLNGQALESATPLMDVHLLARTKTASPSPVSLKAFERILSNYRTIDAVRQLNLLDEFTHQLDAIASSNNETTPSALNAEIRAAASTKLAYGALQNLHIHAMRMVGMAVDERPRDFMESLLGYAHLATLAGFRGLVVTIDEFEVEYFLTSSKLERVAALLTVMREAFRCTAKWSQVPLGVFIATVGQEGHVGDLIVGRLLEQTGGGRRNLRRWPNSELRTLAKMIHGIYCDAYGGHDPFDDCVVDHVEASLERGDAHGDGLIRAFVKRYVAALDVRNGPPWN